MPAEFATFIVVRGAVKSVGAVRVAIGKVYRRDLEIVLGLTGGVGTEEEAMDGVRLVGWSERSISDENGFKEAEHKRFFIREPLARQTGP